MDLTQKRLPLILIIILVGILIFQYTNAQNNSKLIDSETCELYIKDNRIGGKQYLNEFDPKCLEFKNISTP